MGKRSRKPLTDRYVFSKVMQDNPNLCKEIAELALDKEISHVEMQEVESEENTVSSRGVRFDVYIKADDILIAMEMQVLPSATLSLRNRYYHAWLDRRALAKGKNLAEMPRTCVVFICMFDPIGWNEPVYDIARYSKPRCGNELNPYDDRAATIVLNAKSDLSHAVPAVAELLQYLAAGVVEKDGGLPSRLEAAIEKAYQDEEWVSSMSILEVDRATRDYEIAEQARAEGRVSEHVRQSALIEALRADGRESNDIIETIMQDNLDELYLEYGIE